MNSSHCLCNFSVNLKLFRAKAKKFWLGTLLENILTIQCLSTYKIFHSWICLSLGQSTLFSLLKLCSKSLYKIMLSSPSVSLLFFLCVCFLCVLAHLDPLHFCIHFRINLSISSSKGCWNLDINCMYVDQFRKNRCLNNTESSDSGIFYLSSFI